MVGNALECREQDAERRERSATRSHEQRELRCHPRHELALEIVSLELAFQNSLELVALAGAHREIHRSLEQELALFELEPLERPRAHRCVESLNEVAGTIRGRHELHEQREATAVGNGLEHRSDQARIADGARGGFGARHELGIFRTLPGGGDQELRGSRRVVSSVGDARAELEEGAPGARETLLRKLAEVMNERLGLGRLGERLRVLVELREFVDVAVARGGAFECREREGARVEGPHGGERDLDADARAFRAFHLAEHGSRGAFETKRRDVLLVGSAP